MVKDGEELYCHLYVQLPISILVLAITLWGAAQTLGEVHMLTKSMESDLRKENSE